VVELLLNHRSTNVNAIYSNGESPLILSLKSGVSWAVAGGNIARWLLERGADPSACSRTFHSPLHTIIDRSSENDLRGMEMFDLLLSHGAKRDALTANGKTALSMAATRRLDMMCHRLLLFGDLPYDGSPKQQNALLETIGMFLVHKRFTLLKLLFEGNYSPELRRIAKDFRAKLPADTDSQCYNYLAEQVRLAGQPMTLQETVRLQLRRTLCTRLDDFLDHYDLPKTIKSFLKVHEF
jgi:ankyrin repeat protein